MATLDYVLPVLERFSGVEMGLMEVRFRVDGLLPPGFFSLGVAGSIPAVFDSRNGTPLAPLPIEAELFNRSDFQWRGEDWVAEDRVLGDPPVQFVLAAPIEPVTAPFDRAAERGVWAIILTVALSFALVTAFARWLTRPLEKLAEAAKSVASGKLAAHVEESGPPGVRHTAEAFNAMSTTLKRTLKELARQEAVAAVGEFAADLAHEVRNPLTAIRTDLQRAQRKVDSDPQAAMELVVRAVGAVDHLNATVSDFLNVARSGSVSLVECDLLEPLEAAARASEPQRVEAHCVFEYQPPPRPIVVLGDPDALERLALNLLLNAVEAAEPGAAMGIRVRDAETETFASVEFWDRGPGIPDDLRESIFDPFVTTRNGGTGLGLAIAQRIARAHGSDLILDTGSGETVFRLNLRKVEG
jgi:signal transduction histidine kinase